MLVPFVVSSIDLGTRFVRYTLSIDIFRKLSELLLKIIFDLTHEK